MQCVAYPPGCPAGEFEVLRASRAGRHWRLTGPPWASAGLQGLFGASGASQTLSEQHQPIANPSPKSHQHITKALSFPYVRGTLGGVCSQGQGIDEKECRSAAVSLGLEFRDVLSWDYIQAGCWVNTNGVDAHFNTHAEGKANAAAYPVCQAARPSFPTSKQLLEPLRVVL